MDRRLLSMSCCNKSGNNCNLYASSPLFLTTHTTSLSLSPDRPLLWAVAVAVAVAAPPYSRGNQTLGRSKAATAGSSAESRARVNAALQAPG